MNYGNNPTSRAVFPEQRRENRNSKWVIQRPFSNQAEIMDSKATAEDVIAAMLSASASPPFFNGSPPSRPMNPLIHDVRFVNYGKQFNSLSSSTTISASTSVSCAGPKLLGQNTQAPPRIEGFDSSKLSSESSV
ncbi:hypothetical protein H5410_008819 [Solanum commersonii]|uniref:Uncharacterized protein n=1 Tax=Solanum commersonii TaxID=4109 RepID=A0A9J6AGQ5_SOLCO|nr:hypothetical protein H5410_008806 [Solanum commersonii]KAG5623601.1 hypothetical protein H5410_008819 [Solanum commersonii]